MKLLYMDLETFKVDLQQTLTRVIVLLFLWCVTTFGAASFFGGVAWLVGATAFLFGAGFLTLFMSFRFTSVALRVLAYRVGMLEAVLGIRESE